MNGLKRASTLSIYRQYAIHANNPYLFTSALIIYLANLGTFQTTAMLPGKYLIVLMLNLAYPISWAIAGLLAKQRKEHNAYTSLHSEDLEEKLRRFFRRSLLVNKLLDRIFIPPPLVARSS
ncbi:MAG: hypothetical protein AAFP88_01795 [Bacteroidota bacterium]